MNSINDLYNFGVELLGLFSTLLNDLVNLLQYQVGDYSVLELMFGFGLLAYIVSKIII